ncbi:MAG: dihydroorotate dehydrogenase [Candidatus Aenigmarchaeota archaeon]|nr:dihydroorotate dehydrogenase [Candidatus Aenigmarchaeota archaeon]
MVSIETSICGVRLVNPTVLASGIVGVSGAALVFAAKNGAGAVVSKSIGPREREGHNNPVLVEFEGGFLNAVGLPNSGVENTIDEIKFAIKHSASPVIASIFGGTKEEFGLVAERISEAKPPLIEVNLSCPNTASDFGMPFALSSKDAAEVISIVKDNTKIPVIAKLAPNVPSIKEIAKAVADAGADAISAINTMPGMVIDIKTSKPVLHNKEGGVSGPALKPIAMKCVYDIYESVDIPIIGIGGVTYGKDAVELAMAGACAVQIGTGIYYRGIEIFKKVSEEIKEFLQEHGYDKLEDIIGIAHDE